MIERCVSTPTLPIPQALLKTATSNAMEVVRSGVITDVVTLALTRALSSGVESLANAWREGERNMSQRQSENGGDPTADADGVTDSQARMYPQTLVGVK